MRGCDGDSRAGRTHVDRKLYVDLLAYRAQAFNGDPISQVDRSCPV
jgi:hypothetical protein